MGRFKKGEKNLCVLAAVMLVLLTAWGIVWAVDEDYNRLSPRMDYVPQEMGVFDTSYENLEQADCRKCHGENLADRHHYLPRVRDDLQCDPCHSFLPDPPGIIITRDCTAAGCHSWDDIYSNGWHHDTSLEEPDACVICHNPNLVSPVGPFLGFGVYPPTVVPPAPFACENCHWDQEEIRAASLFDPQTSPSADAGHPSTYDHLDVSGQLVGYLEYELPIIRNSDSHHMGNESDITTQCQPCHGGEPGYGGWDPTDGELIRHCEICHDRVSLHDIDGHVPPGDGTPYGWEAVGFHVSEGSDIPTVYQSFSQNQCWGCHNEMLPIFWDPPHRPAIHNVSQEGAFPSSGCEGSLVEVRGENFGSEQTPGSYLQIMERQGGETWIALSPLSWSDTKITFEVPKCSVIPGTYWIRVLVQNGWAQSVGSSRAVFTVKDCCGGCGAIPNGGPFGVWVGLIGLGGFDGSQGKMYDGYSGVARIVDFVAPSGKAYTATRYRSWSNEGCGIDRGFEVEFLDLYEDLIDQETGQRNYVQDDGTTSAPVEPTLGRADILEQGFYQIFIRTIEFGDEDGSGDLSAGDTILSQEAADALLFELEASPYLKNVKPKPAKRKRKIRILGYDFGDSQGTTNVRIGKKAQYFSPLLGQGRSVDMIKTWSDTKIVAKLKVPSTWIGKTRYLWLEKDGRKTNFKRVQIVAPPEAPAN